MKETALSPKTSKVLSISSTTANVTVGTQGVIRLVASIDCFVVFGSSAPAAVLATSMFLPALSPEYFDVSQFYGQGPVFVGAITTAASGSLYITACN